MNKKEKFKETDIGQVPENWHVLNLKDVCVEKDGIQTGPFGSQLHMSDYVENGTPILTVEHLGENYIIHENLPEVSQVDFDRLKKKYSLIQGDIVFSRVGSVDRRALVRKNENGWLFSGRCLRVRANPTKVNSNFLSYFFGLESFKQRIRSVAVGATMPSLNTKLLSEIKVVLPPLDSQIAIAKILSDLDTKIELNRSMNQTLESICGALFKRWFVDFEFPNEKGQPYKSSGGKMVESELGKIPEGWKVEPLGKMAEITSGKRPNEKSEIRSNDFSVELLGASSVMGYVQKALYTHPIIVTGRVGTHGVIQRITNQSWPSDNTLVIIPNYYEYVFQILNRIDFYSLNIGSTQPLITQSQLKKQVHVVPDEEILENYEKVSSTLYSKWTLNKNESENLGRIRDALLPRLMSGKIRVPV